MKETVFLIGFRGTGKTTVGRLLARTLEFAFHDTDQCICQKTAKSIKEIVDQEGWDGFRRYERDVLTELGNERRAVIATGGGAVLHPQFWRKLGPHAVVIWLTAASDVVLQRILSDTTSAKNRPALTSKEIDEEILEVFRQREPWYREFSHFSVDTGKMGAQETVEAICKQLSYDNATDKD